jgi:chitinase
MSKYKTIVLSTLAALSIAVDCYASPNIAQPTSCITSQFSSSGNSNWKQVNLKLTNNCGKGVDFQNSTINFKSKTAIKTDFWGSFNPLPYPDNNLTISSQPSNIGYTATLSLHFPSWEGSSTILPAGKSINIIYGVPADNHIEGSTNVYLSENPGTGTLSLKNATAKPSNISQSYAVVHIMMNGQIIQDAELFWGQTLNVSGLAAGNYSILPENIIDSAGATYQGLATPQTVDIITNQITSSTITYNVVKNSGNIAIKIQNLPSELTGYIDNPTVAVIQSSTGTTSTQMINWGQTTTISNLKDGGSYSLNTPQINYNNYSCTPTFQPSIVIAQASTTPLVNLTYQCKLVAQAAATINLKGAPSSLISIKITLTPNDNSAPITKSVDLVNGTGSTDTNLIEGVIYTVSAENVPGYTPSFSPNPLTAIAGAVETITFTKSTETKGRLITYIPGWKTPPSAQALANAGYTHVMIAFGVFSTTVPGEITPAFDTVTKEYIQSLHNYGIKVILSLGGALTTIPNTSVDFHQVLSTASSPSKFQQTFIDSLNKIIAQYGFDGFDIDIEHGLTAGGSFAQPQGDIAVLAYIINTMHQQYPNLLITLTPQVANISATRSFDQTWGNYASLVMQTYDSLAWVGIQLYNTGCAYGINLVCYADSTNTPDFSVAMATDLLENWPAIVNNRASGFQPYISYLKPSQIVLGYPAPDANGNSDGAPAKPTSIIKRAIQCLQNSTKSSTGCDSYIAPRSYGQIGGVFNWEATYDQKNNFKFASDLKNCVINGLCN